MLLWVALTFLVASVVAAVGVFGIVYRDRAPEVKGIQCLKGKTVVITGASSGIGREAAKSLAKKGARLILACRNVAKADAVAADIRSITGNKEVLVMELDTASLTSVRRFAERFLNQEERLDVLILNAGIFGTTRRHTTAEGLELVMATNHFGHFLLANLLLGCLLHSSPSRIVVSSSAMHRICKTLDPANLNFEKEDFTQFLSYSQSKSCNILFTRHLAEIIKDTGVVVNSFCPGLVSTEIFSKTEGFLVGKLERYLAPFIGRTPYQGAQPMLHLAAAKDTEEISGEFFENCKISEDLLEILEDAELARNVWEASEKIVNLKPEEKYF